MPRTSSPRRYAQAIFRIAEEQDSFDSWREDLRVLVAGLEDHELSQFLDAPQVPTGRKLKVIRDTMINSIGPLALNLVSLLAVRNMTHTLERIIDEYERLVDSRNDIERGQVISALPLDDHHRKNVIAMLSGLTGKDVRLTQIVDPNILGGIIAQIGDRVIDGSTKTKLLEMRKIIGRL